MDSILGSYIKDLVVGNIGKTQRQQRRAYIKNIAAVNKGYICSICYFLYNYINKKALT